MQTGWQKNFDNCQLGDRRLTHRALKIGQAISEGFGQALSSMFENATALKRAYEFSPMSKPALAKLLLPIAG